MTVHNAYVPFRIRVRLADVPAAGPDDVLVTRLTPRHVRGTIGRTTGPEGRGENGMGKHKRRVGVDLVNLGYHVDNRVTIAHLGVVVTARGVDVARFDVFGRAVRQDTDEPNEEAGKCLAVGRALVSAGNRLIKRGDGLVKHGDDLAAAVQAKANSDLQAPNWTRGFDRPHHEPGTVRARNEAFDRQMREQVGGRAEPAFAAATLGTQVVVEPSGEVVGVVVEWGDGLRVVYPRPYTTEGI